MRFKKYRKNLFKFYVQKGRKLKLKKKFINIFFFNFNNVFDIKNEFMQNVQNINTKVVLWSSKDLGSKKETSLYSIFGFYNVWYNQLSIQYHHKLHSSYFKRMFINFELKKNYYGEAFPLIYSYSNLLQQIFYDKTKTHDDTNFKTKIILKKKYYYLSRAIRRKKLSLLINNSQKDIYGNKNFKFINFHKLFLNIISLIKHNLSFYYCSLYNHSDYSFPIPAFRDSFLLKDKSLIKNQFLNHLNIVFSFVKNKFVIVNLIDPSIGLNLFSSHPSFVRRRFYRLFEKREHMNKYLFLYNLKKKKALKNKFLRTLTLLAASKRLSVINKVNPRILNLIIDLPRHLIDKTLFFGFLYFINNPKKRLNNSYKFKKLKSLQSHKLKILKKNSKSSFHLLLKFLIKYTYCGNILTNKKSLFFFILIYSFLIQKIRTFIIFIFKQSSFHLRFFVFIRNYLYALKRIFLIFLISSRLKKYKEEPHNNFFSKKINLYRKKILYNFVKKVILSRTKKHKFNIKYYSLSKIYSLYEKNEMYKNIYKKYQKYTIRKRLNNINYLHNIVFTSSQSHGAFTKISKNRRI